jgi:Bacterial Ig domain
LTTTSRQAWTSVDAQIVAPTNTVPVGAPLTVTLQVPGMDISGARVVWEARDQEPAYGSTFTFAPVNNGVQWIEAEAQWPDGRRAFATVNISANSPVITWVDGSLPAGAVAGADGGDSWTWTNSTPPTVDGSMADVSANAAGEHEHFFSDATATLQINVGDIMFAYVYLDPANPPTEVMLQWNDGTSWNHRAYWGADSVTDGTDGTVSRYDAGPLPALGQWVELQVSASAVGLEDTNVAGMAFTLYGGDAMWGTAGKISPSVAFPTVAINSPTNNAVVSGPTVTVSASASATVGNVAVQFELDGASVGSEITNAPCKLTLNLMSLNNGVHTLTAIAQNSAGYQSTAAPVAFVVNNNPTPVMSITPSAGGMMVTWPSSAGRTYYVAAKTNLSDANWINLSGNITATNSSTSWTDHAMGAFPRRFYVIVGANLAVDAN